MPDPFVDSLESYLRAGKVEPSCHLIQQAAFRPGARQGEVVGIVTQTLERLLDSFTIDAVVRFFGEADTSLPPEIAEAVKEAIGGRLGIIDDWSKRFDLIARERLARELRAAVRSGEIAQAAQVVTRILGSAGLKNPTPGALEYVGNLLGSVDHGQREAERLIAHLSAGGGGWTPTPEQLEAIDRARKARTGAAAGEFREAEFVREINSMAVELKGRLPGPRVTGAPTEEHIVRFYEALHAVAASVFLADDSSRWTDVSRVLVEFCPRELSEAGRRAGAEERAFMTITPTARRAVFEAFGRLGRNEKVASSYLAFASTVRDERLHRNVLEVMGTLRGKGFLAHIGKAYESASTAAVRSAALVAASNFADGDSAEFLLKALTRAIGKGKRRGVVPEGPHRREAVDSIFGLGRIVRSPRMDAGGRNEILQRAIAAMPESDDRLRHELACQFFMTPAEGWDSQRRDWAVETLTRNLWLGDLTPEFAEGDDRQKNILGDRNRTVQALTAIGRDAVPGILKTCEESDLRYGGAYIALAEILGRLGGSQALGLLERMLATALMHDDSDRTKYQTESYYDSTEGVRKDLTVDQVVSSVLFAVEKIGGEEAERILVRAYNQIFAPGVAPPGPETNEVLERVRAKLVRENKWTEAVRKAGERRPEPSGAKKNDAAARREAAAALKELRARGFWRGKRREKKVTAIQTLASQCNLEAIPLIVEQLGGTDAIVRAAAETALGEYALAASNESVMRALTYALLDGLRSRNDNLRAAVSGVLRRLGPHRDPLRSKLVAIVHTESDALLRAEANRLLTGEGEDDVPVAADTAAPRIRPPTDGPAGEEAPPPSSEDGTPQLTIDDKIRLKRDYLEARRVWIRGGKKGPPPEPPPGT